MAKTQRRFKLALVCILGFILGTPLHTAICAQPSFLLYDARPLKALDLSNQTNVQTAWDTMHVLSALQGLANRDEPRLYVLFCSEFGVDTDQFWLDWLLRDDPWLKGARADRVETLPDLLKRLRKFYKGLVVYDGDVPATSNLASTAAGCEDLLPVRYDTRPGSVFHILTVDQKVPVRLWLVNADGTRKFTAKGTVPDSDEPSTGSAKADAYIWALRRFIERSLCAEAIAAYYLDAFWLQQPRQAGPELHTLSNHDYFIARKAFFFDLSTWGDEKPGDDLQQRLGLDREMFLRVMRSLYDHSKGGIIKVGGFTPWPFKYTSHAQPPGKYEGVPTEWEFGRLISQFNGYMEADAAGLSAIANASFFQHYPLKERYSQPNQIPGLESWRARGYVTSKDKPTAKLFLGHYVGDYDAPSWLYKAVPKFFNDPARGTVPLAWAFNPNLSDRAPQALVYAYSKATTNDFFISGDSGAGYLNPRALTVRPDSGLPSGLQSWARHCEKHFKRWDMSITGFILDGSGGRSGPEEFAVYQRFSPRGAGTHFEPGPKMFGDLPTCPERDLPDEPSKAVAVIMEHVKNLRGEPGFLWARSILKAPSWYAQISEALRKSNAPVEVVDPYTFFGLVALQKRERPGQ